MALLINSNRIDLVKEASQFILKQSLVIVCFQIVFVLIIDHFGISLQSSMNDWSPELRFFSVVLLAPILETWLLQYLPFKLIQKNTFRFKRINSGNLYLCVSSSAFSLMHYSSMWYMLYALVPGAILSFTFWNFFIKRRSLTVAFLVTAGLHSVVNLFIYILSLISQ